MENIENMEVVIENDIILGEGAQEEAPAASLEILSEDISDVPFCHKCLQRENRQTQPGLVCTKCEKFVHQTCLTSSTPGNITGDVFFEFTCAGCSHNQNEVFERKKATFTWLNAIYLTLYHLTVHNLGISNRGFFHYKTHIASFIDRNWQILFGPQFKQKKKWIGTIAGQLSMHSGSFFNSGTQVLQEGGWWQPKYKFSPAVSFHIWHELTREKWVNNRLYKQSSFQKSSLKEFVQKVWQLGYDDLLVPYEPVFKLKSSTPEPSEQTDEFITAQPKKALNVKNEFKIVYYNCDGQETVMDSDTSSAQVIPADANLQIINAADIEDQLPSSVILPGSYEDAVSGELSHNHQYLDETAEPIYMTPAQSYLTPINTNKKTIKCVNLNLLTAPDRHHVTDSEETLSAASSQMVDQDVHAEEIERRIEERRERKHEYERKAESLFSFLPNSTKPSFLPDTTKPNLKLVQMSEYEEVQLLKKIDSFIGNVGDLNKKYELRRFRAKLALRRLKRNKRIPVFDIDKTVKALCGYSTGDEEKQTFGERVLDRFQTSFVQERLSGSIASAPRGPLLLAAGPPCALRAPRSGLSLRPYIRRDAETMPTWLQLGEQLLKRTRRNNPDFVYQRATIDYCYIRPHHIAAVNRLLSEFFWPGIDISESLQYPEYSCVVTYKAIVVGCALCVPESTRQAYITFVVVRPEWRRAKIATTMLYHLLQTTTGMDVTLHVSPTNPAIFLYQMFGFKVEEFIQDFYEKYYDIDYKGCRHALFLRLVR